MKMVEKVDTCSLRARARPRSMQPDEVSSFVQDFLETSGGGNHPPARKKQKDVRADKKRERERRRRADFGEKFEELTRHLVHAEATLGIESCPVTSEESRSDVLQRTIDALAALGVAKKPSVDECKALGGLLGVAHESVDASTQTEPLSETVLIVAQAQYSRGHLEDLVSSGRAVVATDTNGAIAAAVNSLPAPDHPPPPPPQRHQQQHHQNSNVFASAA